MPLHIKGVTNLRGNITQVVDARIRFEKSIREYDDRTCIIVTNSKGIISGLVVDQVMEVVSLKEEDITPPLEIGSSERAFIQGFGKIDGNVVLLINTAKLRSD